jgi:outer membrane lipoprotein LolB
VARSALGFAAAVLLAGCAALSEAPVPSGGFELSGRVAVRYDEQALSARMFWRHSEDSDELLITSPLGQGLARITRRRGEFLLATGNGKEYHAADAETLTEEVLGWRLPLDGLADWVQGRPKPGVPSEFSGGGAGDLRQDGWLVHYDEFRDGRPFRMLLAREDLEIRLIIDRWKK